MLFALWKVSLIWARSVHSTRMCFTVYSFWHAWHIGCCFLRVRMCCLWMTYTKSGQYNFLFHFFLQLCFHSLNVGLSSSNLLCLLLFQHCCVCCSMYLFIFIFKSVYGILNFFHWLCSESSWPLYLLDRFHWFQYDLGPNISVHHYYLINFLICIVFLLLMNYQISCFLMIPTVIMNQKR